MIMNNRLTRLRPPAPSTFRVVETIIILQTPALILINPQLFDHLDYSVPAWHTCVRGGARPCCPSSRLSSLSLPLSSPRLTELMQLILVPSVTSTATEYMFLMG